VSNASDAKSRNRLKKPVSVAATEKQDVRSPPLPGRKEASRKREVGPLKTKGVLSMVARHHEPP